MEAAAAFITRHSKMFECCRSDSERESFAYSRGPAHSCPQFIHTLCSNTEC